LIADKYTKKNILNKIRKTRKFQKLLYQIKKIIFVNTEKNCIDQNPEKFNLDKSSKYKNYSFICYQRNFFYFFQLNFFIINPVNTKTIVLSTIKKIFSIFSN